MSRRYVVISRINGVVREECAFALRTGAETFAHDFSTVWPHQIFTVEEHIGPGQYKHLSTHGPIEASAHAEKGNNE